MRLLKTFLTSAYPFVKHSSLSFEPGARSFERSARTVCSAWKKFDACAPFSASARATAILSTIFQHILHHQRSMSCGPKSPQSAPSELQLERRGPLCVVLLNRPKALNSLTTKMVEDLGALLAHWERSDDVAAVVAKGAGGKAFCAGGDVKAVATKGREGDAAEARRFFRSEYRMNAALSHFEKPYIAILDGITMGGGAGVSVHGPVRVATEKTVFAMPECAIGLFPDVGGSYFLSRLSNGLGLYLGLTGARLKGVDVLHAGIATHYIPSVRIPEAEDAIAELGWQASSLKRVNDCLFKIQQEEEIPEGELNGKIDVIDDIFGRERKNVEEIYEACDRYSSTALGREIANQLRKGSPTSQRIVLEQMKRGVELSLDDCLRMEYRISHRLSGNRSSDFYEGVDAALIRKDGCPRWHPPHLEEVSEEDIKSLFEPLEPHEELQFAIHGRTKL